VAAFGVAPRRGRSRVKKETEVRTSAAKARTAFQRVQTNLKAIAAVGEPETVAVIVGELMKDIENDLDDLICYLDCSKRRVFDQDDLRTLLLGGDSLILPLATFAGPGKLTLAVDAEVPVHLTDNSVGGGLSMVWRTIQEG
jgi:hypothetical protein